LVRTLAGVWRDRPRSTSRTRWTRVLAACGSAILLCSAVADVSPALRRPIPAFVIPPDPRISRLERFFHSYRCPEPHHVDAYLRAADDYGLDYRLLPAVSIRESRCGAEESDPNNFWGYHPGHQSFPTVEEGIDYVSRQLSEGFYYRGKTLQSKLFTYNPLPAYPGEVQFIMRQIEP
jgi:hypothetical protein